MALDLVGMLVGPFERILDKVIPDKDAREKMAHELATMGANMAHEVTMAQLEVNKQEAAHKSLFVAGWRPWIGWACGIAFTMNYVLFPMANMVLSIMQVMVPQQIDQGDQMIELMVLLQIQPLDMSVMMPVLMGMLGLGTMRSVEKTKGVARER